MPTKIKAHGELKLTPNQPLVSLHSLLRKELRVKPGEKIPYVIDAHCAVLYDSHASPEKVIEGLEALLAHLKVRVEEVEE